MTLREGVPTSCPFRADVPALHMGAMNLNLPSSFLFASLLLACGAESPAPKTVGAPSESAVPAADRGAPAGVSREAVVVPKEIQAVVESPDRPADDRKLDDGRRPGELLAFFEVRPGMKVAELAAGGGYTSELLARAVGPTGKLYAQNSPWILSRFAEKPWTERLKKPVMKNVVRVDREFESPLPEDAKNLDIVFDVLFYHDTFWLKVDREKMNHAIFDALKPGGVYAIVDHSGRPGTGATETDTLHRIEEKVVREEIERAGFRFAGAGTFLREPTDPRNWNASPGAAGERRGKSDRFALKFVKP